MTVRLVHLLNVLLLLPIACLGFMAGFSGGGNTPAFQEIGGFLLTIAPLITIGCIIAAEILWRFNRHIISYIVSAIPLIVFITASIVLEITTGFFS